MHVRPALIPDDIPEILRMGREFTARSHASRLGAYSEANTAAFLEAQKTGGPVAVFLAEEAGQVVGMTGGIAFPLFWAADLILAQELFWWVDPGARGSSASRLLREALEDWARTMGAKGFYMVALHDENAGRVEKLYRRAGYEPTEHTYLKEL